jgi:hypothetical protein
MTAPDTSTPVGAGVRQDTLFELGGPPRDAPVDTGFGTARRISLDGTSWVEHVPGCLRADGRLFDELINVAP